MYVNLVTGECGWDEPSGVKIKRLHEQDGHQWWELFDNKTSRFYYYNATTQQTCWQKPKSTSAIIIPLAKFQLLKQTNGTSSGLRSSPPTSNQNGSHSSSKRLSTSSRSREMKDVSCQTRTSCSVLVNNSTQTTPPPSLRRNMVYYSYYGGDGAVGGQNDTWSTKRSLRSYLINEARSARGLSGVAGQEDASDFDDEVWESEDDYDNESTTSDQWDADDEHDHEEGDEDEEDLDEEVDEEIEREVVTAQPAQVVTRKQEEQEYETETDDLDAARTDSRARDSGDNQSSMGETYVDTSFVFVPNESSSSWNRNGKKEKLKHSQTLQEEPKRRLEERNGSFSGSDHNSELNRRGSTGRTGPPSYIPSPPSSSWKSSDRKPHPPPHQHPHPSGPPPPPPPARGHSLNSSESLSRSRDAATNNASSPSSSLLSSSSRPSPHSLLAQEVGRHHRDHPGHSFTPPAPPAFSSPSAEKESEKRQRKTSEGEGRSSAKSKDKKSGRNSDKKSASSGSKVKSSQDKDPGIMEKFARENVVRHIKRGVGNQLLKRKTSLKAMLTWSKNSIRQPMIATLTTTSSANKSDIKTEAIQCFKLIQQFMGDRIIASSSKDSSTISASIVSGKESIAFELVTLACQRHELRDEIYVQLCRQTTNNPKKSSLMSGFELMACCLMYFPPSVKFSPYLASFLANSPAKEVEITCKEDEEIISLIEHCYRLLVKVRGLHLSEGSLNSLTSTGIIYCRKPVTPKELEMVMEAIERKFVGIFGESIDALLKLQSRRWPNRRLPWILTTLCEAILKMGGAGIEGIFRIAADTDELSFIKLVIDCINFDLLDDDGDILELLNHNTDEPVDVHVFACLLKQWFRSLKDPIIPYDLYEECLESSSSRREIAVIILEKLPKDNRLVLGYLIRFLQVFAAPENVNSTKMDDSNLSMIWAPNILRSTQSIMNPFAMHPSVVFENTRKEMTFIRTLINTLDTSFIQGIY